ncbi:MAG: lysylphosphatidylglycerol synthase transmembrane domain-containing protein [Candidatus Woesearchaeota archaeon]|nr:lysylphosphatidylglycerol synthase transmembrane domain-containing protein [Candidatus Woesearchaeota archaeon]
MALRHWAYSIILLGLAAMIYITWKVGFWDIVDALTNANPVFLFFFLLTSVLIAIMLTYKWQLILHAQGHHIPYRRLFAYRMVGYSVSYLTPTTHVGSEPIRAYLLNRDGIPLNDSLSNVIIDKSIELVTHIAFFFIGAMVIANSILVEKTTKYIVLSLSFAMMLLMGLFIAGILSEKQMFVAAFRFFRLHKIKKIAHIEENLQEIEEQIEYFYRHKRMYFRSIIVIILVLWVLMFFEYRFALLMLGHEATVVQIFLILTGVGIAYSIPIPAAMGVLELGQISAAKVLQLSTATGVALAFIIRARDLIWSVLGFVYILYYKFNFRHLAKETKEIRRQLKKGTS